MFQQSLRWHITFIRIADKNSKELGNVRYLITSNYSYLDRENTPKCT